MSRPSFLNLPSAVWLGLSIAAIAVAVGALLGFAGPLITVGAVVAFALGLWALSRLEVGVWGVIAIITLLPFASLPFKVVFTPTFLDLALGGAVFVYLMQWMTGQRRALTLSPAHGPLLLFMGLAVFSFIAGMPNGPLTSNLIRQFAEMLISLSFVFLLIDHIEIQSTLSRLVGVLMLCGTGAALIAIGLYLLPTELANQLLSALRVFGYPAGDVLRYIEDNPENYQRAIGTSIDPNALGGLLAMMGSLLAPQLLTSKPVLRSRWLAYGAFGIVLIALLLTFSRSALVAVGAALLYIALLRYRRMVVVLAVAALIILVLPITQDYVLRFIEGVQGQDLATQMRFGEYKDALILINRYPVLGVGFAGAPEIDIYLGVSNAYLLLASEMGVVGLMAFAFILAVVFGWALVNRKAVYADEELTSIWLGLHAGLVAALVVGVFDHYFFNLEFQAAGMLFWLYIGLALAATRLGTQRDSEKHRLQQGHR